MKKITAVSALAGLSLFLAACSSGGGGTADKPKQPGEEDVDVSANGDVSVVT